MGRPCGCGPCGGGCGPCYGPDDYDSLPGTLTVEFLGGRCDGSGTPMPCIPTPVTISKRSLNPSGPPCNMSYIRWDKNSLFVIECAALGSTLSFDIVVKYNCRSSDGWRALSFDTLPQAAGIVGEGCDEYVYRPRDEPMLLNGEIWIGHGGAEYWWHIRVTE